MIKIIHIAVDEKFINAAEYLFEQSFPGCNSFFIILPDVKNYKVKHVKKKTNFYFLPNNKKSVSDISNKIRQFDLVVLHSLDLFKALLVKKNPNAIYVWLFWGAEIYNRHKAFKNQLLGTKTQHSVKKKLVYTKLYFKFNNLLRFGVFNVYQYQFKQIKNINYFSILHKEDYDLFKSKKILNNQIKYLKFTYYPLEYILKKNVNRIVTGRNILLGNSASLTNNLIEGIDVLSQYNLHDRKVIIPLSYGEVEYAPLIIKYGKEKLGENFHPLTKFFPIEKYNDILLSCNIAIFNSYRQQAIGNILSLLWFGAKVFFDSRNTFYSYLKRIGCIVYLIDELDNNLEGLTIDAINYNREILKNEISTDKLVKIITVQINRILMASDRNNFI